MWGKCWVHVCSAVGWMAAVVSLNEQRAGPRFKRGEGVAGACSDGELPANPNVTISPHICTLIGYMVNFCAVMLELCKPFFTSDPSGPKLDLISTDYPTSQLCRLDLNGEPCFAQAIISKHFLRGVCATS